LDLKTFKERQSFVECRLTESGDITKILNNLDTKYRVNLPSQLVIKQRNEEYSANYVCADVDPLTVLQTVTRAQTLTINSETMSIVDSILYGDNSDRFNNNAIRSDVGINFNGHPRDFTALLLLSIYTNTSENSYITINISGLRFLVYRFEGSGTGQGKLQIVANRLNAQGTTINQTVLRETNLFDEGDGEGVPIYSLLTSEINTMLYLAQGDKLTISVIIYSPTLTQIGCDFEYSNSFAMQVNATEYKTNTTHRSISTPRLLNRLIYSCINNESPTTDPAYDYLDSTLFEEGSRYGRTYFTDGLSLRTGIIPGIDGAMVISLREVFNALNVPFCLGMGLEQRGDNAKLLFDHRSVFFNPTVKLELGEVKGLTEEFDMKIVFNSLGIEYSGADSQDYENGIHEYLKKTIYTLPTNYVDNALENSSNVKVDGTSIEKLRTNQTIFTQESLQDDDTNYMIRCIVDGGVVYNSQGEEFDSISQTGLQNNTQLFNVDMYAPITMRFWSWLISAGLQYNVSTDEIVIQKSEPDIDVAITIDGVLCDRNNITLTKLHQLAELQPFPNAERPLFDPILYRFTAPMNEDNINLFKAYRHYAISFTYKGKEYKGFAMKIPSLPRKESEFILLKLSKFAENV